MTAKDLRVALYGSGDSEYAVEQILRFADAMEARVEALERRGA